MIRQNLWQHLSSLSVSQKIGLGYALALGIAMSGTMAGFGIGRYYLQQAEKQEEHARNEVELLQRLQSGVLQTRTHQQQLIPLVQYPEKFQDEYAHLLQHKASRTRNQQPSQLHPRQPEPHAGLCPPFT